MIEKRNFTRIIFHTEAIVAGEEKKITGEVENLSMNGMFLRTPERIPINTVAMIRIILSGAVPELSVHVKGRTLRHEEEGMAVQFDEMDLDSFTHLKNIIAYNKGDEADVTEEFSGLLRRKRPF